MRARQHLRNILLPFPGMSPEVLCRMSREERSVVPRRTRGIVVLLLIVALSLVPRHLPVQGVQPPDVLLLGVASAAAVGFGVALAVGVVGGAHAAATCWLSGVDGGYEEFATSWRQ